MIFTDSEYIQYNFVSLVKSHLSLT